MILSWHTHGHWHRQLWGTGAHAPPRLPTVVIFLVTSEPHKTLDSYVVAYPEQQIYRPIALSLFIAWISQYFCVSALNYFL